MCRVLQGYLQSCQDCQDFPVKLRLVGIVIFQCQMDIELWTLYTEAILLDILDIRKLESLHHYLVAFICA